MKLNTVLLCWTLASGCASTLVADMGPHGDIPALMSEAIAEHGPDVGRDYPLAVMLGPTDVRAIDPFSGALRWQQPACPAGPPVANDRVVLIPQPGAWLTAVDRRKGTMRWQERLHGESILGMSVSNDWIVASVEDGSTNRLIGVTAQRGLQAWERPTSARLGVPAAVADVGVVPLGDQIVLVATENGREIARSSLTINRLTHAAVLGDSVVAANDHEWIDLTVLLASAQGVTEGYGAPFRAPFLREMGGGDPVKWWFRPFGVGDGPSEGIIMAGRVVLSVVFDDAGMPIRGNWIHTSSAAAFVGMGVSPTRVVLVDSEGTVVHLRFSDGNEVARKRHDFPIQSALVLDIARPDAVWPEQPSERPVPRERLIEVLKLQHAHSAAAQRVAVDLLWREDGRDGPAAVRAIAHGQDHVPAPAVRRYARHLVGGLGTK